MKKLMMSLACATLGVVTLSACQAKPVMTKATPSVSHNSQKTASGLGYKVIKQGHGNTARANDEVEIRFMSYDEQGRPLDGTMSGVPVVMRPSDFDNFKGLKEALMMMPEGSIYEFYIPAHLGYSEDEGLAKRPATYRVEMIDIDD